MTSRLFTALSLLAAAAGHADGSWAGAKIMSELAAKARDQARFEVQELLHAGRAAAPVRDQGGENVTLATFDHAKGTTFSWRAMNDPVMGGRSHSTFAVEGSEGHFKGTCAVVPFLKAPGFCKVGTQRSLVFSAPHFADASRFIDGALLLEVETSTPEYGGFKVAFGAKGAKRPGGAVHHSPPSFKAGFKVPGKGRTVVRVPFSSFSVDWSDYTGRCDTKDPRDGFQHHCCSAEHPEVCPGAEHLAEITGLELWAEGVAGDFDIKIASIAAGPLEAPLKPLLV